MEIKNIST